MTPMTLTSLRNLQTLLIDASDAADNWNTVGMSMALDEARDLLRTTLARLDQGTWPTTDAERAAYVDWQRQAADGDTHIGFRDWLAVMAIDDPDLYDQYGLNADEAQEADETGDSETGDDVHDTASHLASEINNQASLPSKIALLHQHGVETNTLIKAITDAIATATGQPTGQANREPLTPDYLDEVHLNLDDHVHDIADHHASEITNSQGTPGDLPDLLTQATQADPATITIQPLATHLAGLTAAIGGDTETAATLHRLATWDGPVHWHTDCPDRAVTDDTKVRVLDPHVDYNPDLFPAVNCTTCVPAYEVEFTISVAVAAPDQEAAWNIAHPIALDIAKRGDLNSYDDSVTPIPATLRDHITLANH